MSYLYKFLNSKFFIFITFTILFYELLLKNYPSVFFLDDMSVVFSAPYDWKNFWQMPDHGTYIANIPIKIFGFYLANIFQIHPQNFINNFGVFIRCFLFLLIPYQIASFTYIDSKKNIYFTLCFIFLYFLIFNSLRFSMVELAMTTAFYRFTFPIVIWLIFWIHHYKYYQGIKHLIISSILALILGNSSEIYAIISICTFILLFTFDLFSSTKLSVAEKIKEINIKKYIPMIFLLTGFIALITNQGFLLQIQIKASRFPDINFLNTCPLILEFLKKYYDMVILKHIIPISIIIFNIVFQVVNNKFKNNFLLHFEIASFISILMFYFCLFFVGKTHYSGDFWICHNDLQFVLHVLLISLAIIMIKQIFAIINQEGRIKKISQILIISGLILSFTINFLYYTKYSEKYTKKIAKIRENMYVYEKMTVHYWAQNKKAIVPNLCDFDNMLGYIAFDTVYRNDEFEADDELHTQYMKALYPNISAHGYLYTIPDKAYLLFIQNNGQLSPIEVKKSDFATLDRKNIKQ